MCSFCRNSLLCVEPFLQAVAEMEKYDKASWKVNCHYRKRRYIVVCYVTISAVESLLAVASPLMTKSMLNEVDAGLAQRPVDEVFVLKKDPDTFESHPVMWRMAHTSDAWASTCRNYSPLLSLRSHLRCLRGLEPVVSGDLYWESVFLCTM